MDKDWNYAPDRLESEVDWAFWRKLPGWSISESAYLLLGLNPEERKTLNPMNSSSEEIDLRIRRMIHFLRRAKQMKEISAISKPSDIVRCAKLHDLPIPIELNILFTETKKKNYRKLLRKMRLRYSELEEKLERIQNENKSFDKEPFLTKRSVYRMLWVMAASHYSLNKENINTADKIEFSLIKFGFDGPSVETINKILKEIKSFINDNPRSRIVPDPGQAV